MNSAITSFMNSLSGQISTLFNQLTGKNISFQPLLPYNWLTFIIIAALILVFVGIFFRMRGSFLRLLALLSLLLALANPVMLHQEQQIIPSVVGVVIDKSESQTIDQRDNVTSEAAEQLKTILAQYPQLEPRFIDAAAINDDTQNSNDTVATRLFTALDKALADVPSNLYAGTIMITDGQVHDVAFGENTIASHHPINVLLTGRQNEFDRQIKIIEPPRFGIKDKPLTLNILLEDKGQMTQKAEAIEVSLYVNGVNMGEYQPIIGQAFPIEINLPLAGKNIIEVRTPVLDGELTSINNRAATVIDAIRQNLRVLLVSGEPHNGERAWRDLLKSDASIDLVHFTILRPPEKADNTPLNQLSLIVFPTTELFVDRLKDFDLVIFDRYQHYNVLPLIYYDFIAEYVKNGGALLVATGPEYSGTTSLALTPLNGALPALPTGNVIEKLFRPSLTSLGLRHPVTRGLVNTASDAEKWGRWLRQIEVKKPVNGQVVMNGADNEPLLLLSHIEKGRVAMLLSDEGWLWGRGFEGGGPYAALYRRIAHWLMQEPELEEEALTATTELQNLTIRRQTMENSAEPVKIISPSGIETDVTLQKQQEGVFSATITTTETGLFEIHNGDKTTLALIGPINAPEYTDFISTKDKLMPILQKTGGHISYLSPDRTTNHIDAIKFVGDIGDTILEIDPHNLILQNANQMRLISMSQSSFFSGFFALFACLLLLSSMWYREGH